MRLPHKRFLGLAAALGLLLTTPVAGAAASTATATSPSADGFGVTVRSFSVTLPGGDHADVYAPAVPARAAAFLQDVFPVVAVLQGAGVDKSQYSAVSRRVASRGFVVVVPNRLRPPGGAFPPGLFTSQTVIPRVLARVTELDADPASPLYKIADTGSLGLLGHSFGGAVGLFASAGVCEFPICDGPYVKPPQLKAAALYGTNIATGATLDRDLDTTGVAIALLQGTVDSIAPTVEAQTTIASLEKPSVLLPVIGANHYGITNVNNPPGAVPDRNTPTLRQEQANSRIGDLAAAWLSTFLR